MYRGWQDPVTAGFNGVMNSGGGTGAGPRDRTTLNTTTTTSAAHAPPTPGPSSPTTPDCTPTDWYIGQIPARARKRRRPIPAKLPATTGELRALGLSTRAIEKNFVRAEHGIWVPRDSLLSETTDSGWRRARRIPAATLALAHLFRHPQRIASGFGAASLYGMTAFVEEELLDILASPGATPSRAPGHVCLHPTRTIDAHGGRAWRYTEVQGKLGEVRFTDPDTTLSHMLATVSLPDEARSRRWSVPDLSDLRAGLTQEVIRGIQVSDAFHQARGWEATKDESVLRVPCGVDPLFAGTVLGWTDVGAESPQETLLRLAVSDLAPGLRSQIPVWTDDGSKLLTSCDLGWEEEKVYLFYDGAHHLQRAQRTHDSKVLAALQRNGGRVFRIVAEDLTDLAAVEKLRETVAEALG